VSNEEQNPTIVIAEDERPDVGRLLTILLRQTQASLDMLNQAVASGESKPDNPNIGRDKRVLKALRALRQKIKTGADLTPVESGYLDDFMYDATEHQDPEYVQEIEDAKEEAGEEFDPECELSEEAQSVYELQQLEQPLRALQLRLRAANYPATDWYKDQP